MITQEEYSQRRNRLIELMGENSITIIQTAPQVERTFDTYYKFRPRSSFYYLTGFDEPQACAVIISKKEHPQYILFCRQRDPSRSAWIGDFTGPEQAIDKYRADQAFSIEQLDEILPILVSNKQRIYYLFDDKILHQRIAGWLDASRAKIRKGITSAMELIHLETILQDLRLYKSSSEIQLLQKAVDITAAGLVRAMQKAKVRMYEYELEAEIVCEFIRNGAEPSFPCMVSSGVNDCLSHYREKNNHRINDGDIVIIDAGAEYQYYTGDLTRTFPINGKFNDNQRNIYELVLDIQTTLIDLVRPEITLAELQDILPEKITRGLLALGVISGDLQNLLEKKVYTNFYMHNMGHWLGLDIHDEASYVMPDGSWRKLKPGMVLTIEPGIYIRDHTPHVDPKWWGIGARIEDNVLVTEDGCRVLSGSLPRLVNEVESMISKSEHKNSTS